MEPPSYLKRLLAHPKQSKPAKTKNEKVNKLVRVTLGWTPFWDYIDNVQKYWANPIWGLKGFTDQF